MYQRDPVGFWNILNDEIRSLERRSGQFPAAIRRFEPSSLFPEPEEVSIPSPVHVIKSSKIPKLCKDSSQGVVDIDEMRKRLLEIENEQRVEQLLQHQSTELTRLFHTKTVAKLERQRDQESKAKEDIIIESSKLRQLNAELQDALLESRKHEERILEEAKLHNESLLIRNEQLLLFSEFASIGSELSRTIPNTPDMRRSFDKAWSITTSAITTPVMEGETRYPIHKIVSNFQTMNTTNNNDEKSLAPCSSTSTPSTSTSSTSTFSSSSSTSISTLMPSVLQSLSSSIPTLSMLSSLPSSSPFEHSAVSSSSNTSSSLSSSSSLSKGVSTSTFGNGSSSGFGCGSSGVGMSSLINVLMNNQY